MARAFGSTDGVMSLSCYKPFSAFHCFRIKCASITWPKRCFTIWPYFSHFLFTLSPLNLCFSHSERCRSQDHRTLALGSRSYMCFLSVPNAVPHPFTPCSLMLYLQAVAGLTVPLEIPLWSFLTATSLLCSHSSHNIILGISLSVMGVSV